MNRNNIYILSKSWVRHGAHSGYEKLIEYLDVEFQIIKPLRLPYKMSRWFSKRTKLKNYRSDALNKEFQLLAKVFSTKLIHILYGDMDFYYAHYLKKFPFNIKRNQIVATFHHPPEELEKRLNYGRSAILGNLDKIIVMGPNQIPFFKKYSKAAIKFIPHGIDIHYFSPNVNVKRKKVILILGVSHRDHERNRQIIQQIQERNLSITFLVVIPKDQAYHYEGIKQVEIETSKIDDEHLLYLYHSSTAILLSLKDCTASNTLLEALATGCPLLINNVGAVKDYIFEDSGLPVFETDDISGSVEFVECLIKDHDYAMEISKKQRKLSLAYDWNIIKTQTQDFILS